MRYTNQHRSNKGFTLIELMIVISIVAILVTLAVPAYRDYMIRAKISECINNAAVTKVAISEYRQTFGAWPPTMNAGGLLSTTGSSKYCTGISDYQSSTGSFTIDVDETAVDAVLTNTSPVFVPTATINNTINWNCTVGTTPTSEVKYLPSSCRDS